MTHSRPFTLVEAMSALLLLGLVLPLTLEGIQINSEAGLIAEHKTDMTILAHNKLNELKVDQNWKTADKSGSFEHKNRETTWGLELEDDSRIDGLQVATLTVRRILRSKEVQIQIATLLYEEEE